ncbi:hypothetical protein QE152_g23515 [Popillia japonica]|uniref:Uncharacterized protein n=1 Tax=Popillia japonica TaxID=7064 RepID=A0AAW1KF37_POPJA
MLSHRRYGDKITQMPDSMILVSNDIMLSHRRYGDKITQMPTTDSIFMYWKGTIITINDPVSTGNVEISQYYEQIIWVVVDYIRGACQECY